MNTPKIDLLSLSLSFRALSQCRSGHKCNVLAYGNYVPCIEMIDSLCGTKKIPLFYPEVYPLIIHIENLN